VQRPSVIDLPQGTLDLLILKALALEQQHGWAIIDRLHQLSTATVQSRQGSLYPPPALHRLARRGWIKARWGTSDENRRAKYYELTRKGRAQLEAHRSAGLDHDDALRRARLAFGGLDQVKEEYRDALGVRLIDDIRRDLHVGIRSLTTSPVVTLVAILSLALVIGANTAIFSILNGLLFRPLPVRDPSRLVHVTDSVRRDDGETRVRAWAYPTWEQIRQRSHLFESATAWSFTRFNLTTGGETRFVEGIWADGGFFEMLGVSAALGRTFSGRDDVRGGGPDGAVAVISHRYWQAAFGGAGDILGRSVHLNGVTFTIVGVMPPDFFGVEVQGRGLGARRERSKLGQSEAARHQAGLCASSWQDLSN
jgi:transcriptional regulator